MPKRILRAIRRLQPWKPTRSLPSYKEPTPETTRKLTREQEAELALDRTTFAPGVPSFLVAAFLLTIVSVPLVQLIAGSGAGIRALNVLPSGAKIAAVRSLRDAWNLLPHAAELKAAEESLESESVVSRWLLPPVQALLMGQLRAATEQVYLGYGGWLFYRPDVDYVTAPAFLESSWIKQRSHAANVQPDSIKAILQFRDQLAARGIELILVPAPTKATIEGEHLTSRVSPGTLLQNPAFEEWKRQLAAAGVRVFDPAPLLLARKQTSNNAPQYLQTDTHWRPEAMQAVAQQLAAQIGGAAAAGEGLMTHTSEVTGLGDIARMLKLSDVSRAYPPQTIKINQVTSGTGLWRPSRDAGILLLGDSFANIFSLEALGWGESAGLAEQLSLALGGQPLDCILRNSDAAFATREMLANELARGRDRLAGKKLVIWEFAARELAFGNWKLLDLKLGAPAASRFFTPATGEELQVTGTIEAVNPVPRPGSVPYADHITAVHLTDMSIAGRAGAEPLQSVVYMWSMRDNIWTPAARLRAGDRVTLRLRTWADVAPQLEQINRNEIDDPEIQLEEPAWGELLP
jgi:alginate O-acetyltransferase complex protein AlgJ